MSLVNSYSANKEFSLRIINAPRLISLQAIVSINVPFRLYALEDFYRCLFFFFYQNQVLLLIIRP